MKKLTKYCPKSAIRNSKTFQKGYFKASLFVPLAAALQQSQEVTSSVCLATE
jgi:hypothetical protein